MHIMHIIICILSYAYYYITNIAGAFCLSSQTIFCALQNFVQKSFKSIYLYILILANMTSSVIMYPVVNLLKVKLVYVPLYIPSYGLI